MTSMYNFFCQLLSQTYVRDLADEYTTYNEVFHVVLQKRGYPYKSCSQKLPWEFVVYVIIQKSIQHLFWTVHLLNFLWHLVHVTFCNFTTSECKALFGRAGLLQKQRQEKLRFSGFNFLPQNGFNFIIFDLVLTLKVVLICTCLVGLLIKPVEKPPQKVYQKGPK